MDGDIGVFPAVRCHSLTIQCIVKKKMIKTAWPCYRYSSNMITLQHFKLRSEELKMQPEKHMGVHKREGYNPSSISCRLVISYSRGTEHVPAPGKDVFHGYNLIVGDVYSAADEHGCEMHAFVGLSTKR